MASVAALAAGASTTITTAGRASPAVEQVVVISQENHCLDNVLGQLCIRDYRSCVAA